MKSLPFETEGFFVSKNTILYGSCTPNELGMIVVVACTNELGDKGRTIQMN